MNCVRFIYLAEEDHELLLKDILVKHGGRGASWQAKVKFCSLFICLICMYLYIIYNICKFLR